MFEQPEVQLSALKKGDCFMFNREPYIVKGTYWENLRLFKRKIYMCRMKFSVYDAHFSPDTEVYRISRELFDMLVQGDNTTI